MTIDDIFSRDFESLDSIKTCLRKAEIKGVQREPFMCPIAKYLNARLVTNPNMHFGVDPHEIISYSPYKIYPTPPAVKEFLALFDVGRLKEFELT